MSPQDAGRVTDAATSLAQLADSLSKLASPAPDEDDLSRLDLSLLDESPPRKADIRQFNDPSNFLG